MAKHDAFIQRKEYFIVDPKAIVVRPGWNPRKDFNTPDDADLKAFIVDNGPTFPPMFVKREGDAVVLVDGERRLRATLSAIEAGNEIVGVPCIVLDKGMNEVDQLANTLTSNNGKPFSPIEEAEAYQRFVNFGMKVQDLAKKIGKARSSILSRLELLKASPEVLASLQSGEIGLADVKDIVSETDGKLAAQKEKLEKARAARGQGGGSKRPKTMSRKSLEREISNMMPNVKKSFGKNLDDASLQVGVIAGLMMSLHNCGLSDATAKLVENISQMKEASVKPAKAKVEPEIPLTPDAVGQVPNETPPWAAEPDLEAIAAGGAV